MRLPNPLDKNPIGKFNEILDELDREYRYRSLDFDQAIIAWCNKLSIDEIFPRKSHNILSTSQKIQKYGNQCLEDSSILELLSEVYRKSLIITEKRFTKGCVKGYFENLSKEQLISNIKETQNNIEKEEYTMSNKLILLIASILTGVGLLLFILNRKDNNNRSNSYQNDSYSPRQSHVPEKYILALLINGDRNRQLINSLKNSSTLTQEDSSQLYGATQALWIGTKSEFNNSLIKSEFNNYKGHVADSEYDVYFITIEMDKIDSRFKQDANQMDRIDAFNELANNANRITVSERLLSKAYEKTEFYSR